MSPPPPRRFGPGDADPDPEATSITNLADIRREMESRQKVTAYVIVLAGSNTGEMHKLEGGEVVIGRGMQATIRLNDDGISRRHARIVSMGNEVIIEDLGSANGTIVNGEAVTTRVLTDGDKIRLGSTTILKFTYHDKLEESFQQQMYDAALRDGLTKAFNKKYFLDRLETEYAYARRHVSMLSLVMFDVDFFKKVNDNYGHLAGDYVLQKLSKIAQSCIRTEDVFARYGGEEFAIICRGIPLINAGIMGERIRTVVEQSAFEFEAKRLPVTISVGVAALPESNAESALALIQSADNALYEAKRSGRNRVILKDLM